MKFLEQIDSINDIIEARKEAEYQKTLFDSGASGAAGIGFAGSCIINGETYNIIGSGF